MKRLAAGFLAGSMSCAWLAVSPGAWAGEPTGAASLAAAEIVAKNVAARGGLEAWQKIRTMVWTGHIESARAPAKNMSFVLEMKRPNKTRFEIKALGQESVRLYDGVRGWKMHPGSGGRPQWQAYSAEELAFARDGGIDEPLIDAQAKGVAVSLEGMDEVEGHKAYRLKVTLPSGAMRRMWIDAATFLDIKYDREVRNAYGQSGTVSVFYRDYKRVDGVELPFTIESGSASGASDKMMLHTVTLNPPLDNMVFAKPSVSGRGNMATVDIAPPGQVRMPPAGFPRLNRPYAPPPSGMAPRSGLANPAAGR